jgi:hypothetical protein
MKRFVTGRMASVALVGALIASGLFLTSTPANAGVIDDCLGSIRSFMGWFRAYDTAAHHEQAPDGLVSRNDVRAASNGRADIGDLPANQRNIDVYRQVQRAAAVFERLPNFDEIWERLIHAAHPNQPRQYFDYHDLMAAAAAGAMVGGVCNPR